MIPQPHKFSLALGAAVLAATTSLVRADIVYTFDADAQGWSVVSFSDLSADNFAVIGSYPTTYNATGGNPGGYISSTDPDGGDFTFAAPSDVLGNRATATGLSYDLSHPVGAANYQATDVLLSGNGLTLLYKANPDLTPGAGFTNVSLAFAPSSNWHVGTSTGALATAADFQSVLGNLTGLYIRGEYTLGGEETDLDNVRLLGANVPEPSSLGLLALAGGVLGVRALRRQRHRSAGA